MSAVRTPRFFVPFDSEMLESALEGGTPVELPSEAANHAGRALRMREGDEATLFNGSGRQWFGPLHFEARGASVLLSGAEEPRTESPVAMTLIQGWVAPEKLDWIVEKAVELGVSRLVLFPARRSVTRLQGDRLEKRLRKYRDVAVSASEQCGRNRILEITSASSLKDALESDASELKLLLAPGAEERAPVGPGLKSVAFVVGPEGGLDPEEIALGESLGWRPVLLGPRVLRTETAGLAAACWINSIAGDF